MVSNYGENLIFIFSLPRSGSTLLGAILGSNSNAFCPPEPWFLLRLCEVRGEACNEKVFDDFFASLATKAFLPEEIFIECARAFAIKAYNLSLKKEGRSIFVDKTPRYYHILSFVDALFPKAKKIWLKRNPLDIAASYKKTWEVGVDVLTGKNVKPASFDFILGLHCLEDYFQDKSFCKYEIKYEDLVCNPENEIKKLCSFCPEMSYEEQMLQYWKNRDLVASLKDSKFGDKLILEHNSIHMNSTDYWRDVLSKNDLSELISVIGSDFLRRTGYEEAAQDISKISVETKFKRRDSESKPEVKKSTSEVFELNLTKEVYGKYDVSERMSIARLNIINRLRRKLQDSDKFDIRKLKAKQIFYYLIKRAARLVCRCM
jgi:hypothetical protein